MQALASSAMTPPQRPAAVKPGVPPPPPALPFPRRERLAPVISHRPGAIVFAVDDVTPATGLLATEPVRDGFARRVERPLHAISGEARVVARKGPGKTRHEAAVHPLVDAVYTAFSDHRPLRLSVDDFALVIAQGFAHHVNQNAAELRHLLVGFEGKHKLVVKSDADFQSLSDWEMAIGHFCRMLREQVTGAAADAFWLDYTTTTPAMRIAGEVAMLDAFQKFFDYIMVGICGIPKIELLGTPDDWQRLLGRVEQLEQFGLSWWTCRVTPILRECIATSEGKPDRHFWQCICKPRDAYGAGIISGWFADLFPWIGESERRRRNPLLEQVRQDWVLVQPAEPNRFNRTDGLAPNAFPAGISDAPVELELKDSHGNGVDLNVSLVGGFLGVSQAADGMLGVELGWAVAEARPLQQLTSRIRKEHSAEPLTGEPIPWQQMPAELVEIVSTLRKIRLFEGTALEWQVGELYCIRESHPPPEKRPKAGLLFARRTDGRVLCLSFCSELKPGAAEDSFDFEDKWLVSTARVPEGQPVLRELVPGKPDSVVGEGSDFQAIDLDIIAALTFLLDHGGRLPDEIDAVQTPSEDGPSMKSRTAPVPSP